MATRRDPGWYKKLVSGKVDHIRNQVTDNDRWHVTISCHLCSLQPARLLKELLLGLAEFLQKSGTFVRFLRLRGSLKGHIKTHLWDLSTNLSKLNIFLKLKNIVLYES